MAWIEQTPTQHARLWRDDSTGTMHASSLCGAVVAYESTLDSGQYDTLVNLTAQRITAGGNDGWRVTQNGWHYFLGQPAGKATDGWVGFGGRQGAHWFLSRLVRVGYLHYPTREWQDIGGAPTYTRAGHLSQTPFTRTIGPNADQQTIESSAQWTGLWSTPGGGDITQRWRVNGLQLKEDIVVNAAARSWIAANAAPTTPISETWFGFVFDLDLSDIPRVVKNSLLQDVNGDFDDSDGRLQLEDALQRILAFLPLDYATVNTTREGGVPPARIPLRKRIYKDGSSTFLLVGARVDQLVGLPAGDVIFDPTFIVAETNEDGHSDGTDEIVDTSSFSSLGYYATGGFPVDGGWIFRSTGIEQGSTIDSASLNLEYNGAFEGLPLDGSLYGYAVDSPTDFNNADVHRISDHHTRTTASVAANIPTAADYTSASLVSILQEIVDRAGFGGDIGLTWREASTNFEYWDWVDYTQSSTDAAELTVTWTPPITDPLLNQFGYRFRNDDGSETTATWQDAENTPVSSARETPFRLRAGIDATNDPPSQGYKQQYRKSSVVGWRDITT